jgi:hypothetical protein
MRSPNMTLGIKSPLRLTATTTSFHVPGPCHTPPQHFVLKNCSAYVQNNELTRYSLYPLALPGWTGRVCEWGIDGDRM